MAAKQPVQLYSVEECAMFLAISTKTMWRIIHQRKIATVRVNRRVLISEQGLMAYVESRTVAAFDPRKVARGILTD